MLQYLEAAKLVGLRYIGGLNLEGMCDSSWGDNVDDKRFQAAYVFTMGGTAVSWKSWKLGEVSRSTTEYSAASDAAAEAKGLVNLLAELNYKSDLPVRIFTDNQGAQAIIENNATRRRTRYIDMKYHFVLPLYRQGYTTFPRVTSLHNYSDSGTKGVGRAEHSFCCHEIGMTTDKSLAFQIEESTREARLQMKKDREEMRRLQVKWHMK